MTNTRPERIDPPGCGCTDCLTGYSLPLDSALIRFSPRDILEALDTGFIQDATGFSPEYFNEWLEGSGYTDLRRVSGRFVVLPNGDGFSIVDTDRNDLDVTSRVLATRAARILSHAAAQWVADQLNNDRIRPVQQYEISQFFG